MPRIDKPRILENLFHRCNAKANVDIHAEMANVKTIDNESDAIQDAIYEYVANRLGYGKYDVNEEALVEAGWIAERGTVDAKKKWREHVVTEAKNDVDTTSLAHRIKTARLTKQWTQEELANAAGIARATVVSIELGRTSPEKSRAVSTVCAVLGLEIENPDRLSAEQRKAMIADFRARVNNPDESASLVAADAEHRLLDLLPMSETAGEAAEINLVLSMCYRKTRSYRKSVEHAELARSAFMVEGEVYDASLALFEIATSDYETGRYDVALARYETIVVALEGMDIPHDDVLLARSYLSLALCGSLLGDYKSVERYLAECEAVGQSLPERVSRWYTATVEYLSAERLSANKQYRAAAAKYESAAAKYREMNDHANEWRMVLDKAELLYKAGQTADAVSLLERIRETTKADDPANYAESTVLLAEIRVNHGGEAYSVCQEIFENTEYPNVLRARALRWAGHALLKSGDGDGFSRHMEQAQIFLRDERDDRLYRTITAELNTFSPLRGLLHLK